MKRAAGFTLIELVTVIIILSVIGVMGSQFIVNAAESYQISQSRARLAATGRQAIERMSRQIRGAMPYSLRVVNSGACLQFMPLAAGGFYLNPVPDDSVIATVATSPFTIDFDSADYISIGALSPLEVYGAGPVSLAAVTSTSATQVNFSSHQWQRNSQSQRFYLVGNAQAFCLNAGELRFYDDIDPTAGSVNLAASYSLMARNAASSAASTFEISGNTAENNFRVSINLAFIEGAEQVDFFQEVSLRNVP
ncbi:prepilin-type N-terminal cleavage/methylation domain-containing protein [Gilvimarinus sp. SDUM040013]|uniref:Prepilin-type N-terminal cleavage/methylation domain-containing protein n=1 Tax=Gilvimarinus gilvus TaxID=3058038 RepID=A0ABU4RU57_9GAMM|nr:prepilin-type N-terminal cleavage/methylation domain-containing protein [Gilvimarinus sp. SDUM040013]MDO3388171.1 prepilin-type N-terminal cleavage/methylation domain-containing protein [Gilvimarinus sp. SDUM040013]MDX6847721.1 prepilin-type N-terminal cleavage/methylation domain-containing protein [Gilvimarinus sp. SDUM040013]